MRENLRRCAAVNAVLLSLLAFYLFIAPLFLLASDLQDPGLSTGHVPRFAFRWHRSLSADFEAWARERVASGGAAALSLHDISNTEWPVFSSVFYLWATESLQQAWEADAALAPREPSVYAREAIKAAAALISDPAHATWVRQYWGEEYLERENLFYRMLLISGLTSYQNLTGDERYQVLLADQVESLAGELDRSPHGLLDDYPGQCYPIDILPAIAAIRRADALLGTDHAAFAARAVRGFEGLRLDQTTGLPAYVANSKTGYGSGPARGVGIAYMLIWSPELWPETTEHWYASYEQHFWQPGPLVTGVREFSRSAGLGYLDWSMGDVDAGPVLAGNGTAASAFGIGAARANGRLDQAYALGAEALIAAWALPDGSLLVPRLLSNLSDAPYTGEAILLFNFTRRPVGGVAVTTGAYVPPVVYLGATVYLGAAALLIRFGIDTARRWRKASSMPAGSAATRLFIVLCLTGGLGFLSALFVSPLLGLLILLLAQVFARN